MNKRFLSLVFSGIMYTCAFSQPIIKAQKDLGGRDFDFFSSMALTKDGGRIVGGSSQSNISGNKTEKSRGGEDFWIVKLDSANKIEFDKTIGGNDFDGLTALQQTSDGGYILGGGSTSSASGEKTQNSKGGTDFWIVKLDSKGDIQFDKTIGGSDNDGITALQQTSDGGYIIGGTSRSNKSGNKSENSRGGSDYWIVKLDGRGNIQFDKTYGGSDDDFLTSLQQTTDGGYILGGGSFSNKSGEKSENSKGVEDFWILKLDGRGNIQFDKTIGGNETDHLSALQQTSDGGYILGGHSFSNISGDKSENSRGDFGFPDYWVVKLGSTGNIQFDKTLGGTDLDILTSLQQTVDGGYILGGRSFSNASFEKSENAKGIGDDDFWIVKLDKNGSKQFDKTIGGTNFDECFSIKEKNRNDYVAGGQSLSNVSGDKTSRSKGLFDYWIVDVEVKTATQTIAATTESNAAAKIPLTSFIIYPNPAKDVLHIQTSGKSNVDLTDASGKTVFTKTISGNSDINISGLLPGIYFLKNQATDEVKKVLVAR